MAATVIPTRFRLRRDSAANWTAKNPILFDGEPALETDTGLRKVGDGSTAWNSLLYQLSGPAYDFANLADHDTPIWDATNKRWTHGPGGKIYQPGTGIEIVDPDSTNPTISSTLGSIALSGRKDDYAQLPTGLGAADAGRAWLVDSDGLVYIWDGSSFPAEGNGVSTGGGLKAVKPQDESRASTTTRTADSDLTVYLPKAGGYHVYAFLVWQVSSNSPIVSYQLLCEDVTPTTWSRYLREVGNPFTGTGTSWQNFDINTNEQVKYNAPGALNIPGGFMREEIVLTVPGPTRLTLYWAQKNSNSSPTTLVAGSYLSVDI